CREQTMDAVEEYLSSKTSKSTGAIVFALRILEALRRLDDGRQIGLAAKIVDAYVSDCTLGRRASHALAEYGDLLNVLRELLRSHGSGNENWERWLRPFDAVALLSAAKEDEDQLEQQGGSMETAFSVTETVRAHTETLAAQGSQSPSGDDFEGILDAI